MSMNLWTLPNLVMKLSSYPDTIIKWNSWHKQRTFLVILKKLKIMVFMTSELFFYWNSEIRSIVLLGILSSVYWHSKINSQQWNSDECRSYFIVIMIVLACKMSSTWEQFYLIYNRDRGNNFVHSAIIWVNNTNFFAVAKVIASLMKQLMWIFWYECVQNKILVLNLIRPNHTHKNIAHRLTKQSAGPQCHRNYMYRDCIICIHYTIDHSANTMLHMLLSD